MYWCHRSMCQWRLLRRHLLIFFVVSVILWLLINNSKRHPEGNPCSFSAEQRHSQYSLILAVSQILYSLHVTHFLCYASLWGLIHDAKPLPWDLHGHLCMLGNEISNYDEASLLRIFRRNGLSLEYSSAEGIYEVRNASLASRVNSSVYLTLFEEDPRVGMYRRVGWKRRLLPPDCEAHASLQCFPLHLVKVPLPKKPFGPILLPVPREDFDLLKFLYPDSWWLPFNSRCS